MRPALTTVDRGCQDDDGQREVAITSLVPPLSQDTKSVFFEKNA